MSLSLGYTFDWTWNSRYRIADRHLLSANWSLFSGRSWSGYAYANYNLADSALSASMYLDYLFTQHWGLDAQAIYQSSQLGSYNETEFSLYRILGARQLRLRYSVERSRLSFEIGNSY